MRNRASHKHARAESEDSKTTLIIGKKVGIKKEWGNAASLRTQCCL